MNALHPDYWRAIRHFNSKFCPYCGMQRAMEGCYGCQYYYEGNFLIPDLCKHPMHPRYIKSIEEYILEAL